VTLESNEFLKKISGNKLKRDFFARPTLQVAKELLGKVIVFNGQCLVINETEAYIGEGDPACHAARGRTKRNEIMFGAAGFSYIYFIYGMYYCLNFVTEGYNYPAAVLIRGGFTPDNKLNLNGPGKLCRYLGLNLDYNKLDIINHESFYVLDIKKKSEYVATTRIGISKGKELLWRFATLPEKQKTTISN
jgi:DNA-3-methyladenine glycosylase